MWFMLHAQGHQSQGPGQCGSATHTVIPLGTSAISSPSIRSEFIRAPATSIAILELKGLLALLQDKYTNAFLGYGPEDTNFGLELTKNYGVDSYNLGSGFGHFGLALQDVYGAVDSIKAAGTPLTHTHLGHPSFQAMHFSWIPLHLPL